LGTRWLLAQLKIYPNGYYNYWKHRKADYYAHKSKILAQIEEIYHEHNGVDGYRSMTVYLERRGYNYSSTTIHKYMNTELGLHSIVRPKKPDYERGKPHKVFENRLKQDFTADAVNQRWCTDFTYLFLKNHEVRYNCSIIDLQLPENEGESPAPEDADIDCGQQKDTDADPYTGKEKGKLQSGESIRICPQGAVKSGCLT